MSMPTQEHTVTAPGGRRLRVLEAGDPGGVPVVAHHGSPGCGALYPEWIRDAQQRGIRLIGFDRPGYGGSTACPGRSVADAASDVEAIADQLGLERLLVWGVSGGGPHALACGALLADRVIAVSTLASFAPYPAEGIDWFAGMGDYNVEEFGLALKGRAALESLVQVNLQAMHTTDLEQVLEGLQSILSPADNAALNPQASEFFYGASSLGGGIAATKDGLIDDDLAFVKPWGFAAEDIEVPVLLWQGGQDWMVPFAHGKWLAARIPGVDARLLPEEGHLTLPLQRVSETHAWLLAQAERDRSRP
jgi:pimeloyl-ACP methyl ester carboxylesterase